MESVVGPGRLELPTSRLSGVCSNQLSYRPLKRMRDRTTAFITPPMGRDRGCGVCGKRNEDGGAPHLCSVFGRPIGSVSVLEVYP